MVHTADINLYRDEEPTSLKYHIVRSGGSDYYLTTNPNQKHIRDPIGPSYYVRVSAASGSSGANRGHAVEDAPSEPDGSFSVIVFVHDYDNVSVSAPSNGDHKQPVKCHEFDGSLVPIMHIRRIDGESKITVTVLDNGESIWETVVALHSDPYTGESKFVFLDPWERRWSLEGNDGIKCISPLYEEPISNLERKFMEDSKIGWIKFERAALKMLDLMVGVNMAVFCFRNYERNPSRLTTVATGILHADLNTVKASQGGTKKKKVGFKLNFVRKKGTESMRSASGYGKVQPRNEVPGQVPEHAVDNQNGIYQTESQEYQQAVPTQLAGMTDDQPRSGIKFQRKIAQKTQGALDEPLPAVLPAFAYQAPIPALPGFSVSMPTTNGSTDELVDDSYDEPRSPSSSGSATPSFIRDATSRPVSMSPTIEDCRTIPISPELSSQCQPPYEPETSTPVCPEPQPQPRAESNATRTSQSSNCHSISRPISIPPGLDQHESPPMDTRQRSRPSFLGTVEKSSHGWPQAQHEYGSQPESQSLPGHLKQRQNQTSPGLIFTSARLSSAHGAQLDTGTAISPHGGDPYTSPAIRRSRPQSAVLSSSRNNSASEMPEKYRPLFLSSARNGVTLDVLQGPGLNSAMLPALTSAIGNNTTMQSYPYTSIEQPGRSDGRRLLRRGEPPRRAEHPLAKTQSISSAPVDSSVNKKKNRLSMMAFVSKFQ
ncbi:hypothetical protein V1517DRAFT_210724 [Lipomyces orientalis]|uniref:Uncharacterized protein n=1 Tax=Lipomyces orientalis TaxID=1233043 RepID=A0ACC3THC0_9ASCO